MSSPVYGYLRTHRRNWALTQKELAFLLGHKSATHVSRLEQGKRNPSTDVVLACEVLFGITPRTCFPKLYTDVEEAVHSRAAILYESLKEKTSKAAMRKKEFLTNVLKRAITSLNHLEGA